MVSGKGLVCTPRDAEKRTPPTTYDPRPRAFTAAASGCRQPPRKRPDAPSISQPAGPRVGGHGQQPRAPQPIPPQTTVHFQERIRPTPPHRPTQVAFPRPPLGLDRRATATAPGDTMTGRYSHPSAAAATATESTDTNRLCTRASLPPAKACPPGTGIRKPAPAPAHI